MDELKPCPFCGFVGNPHKIGCYFEIQNRPEYPSLYIVDGWKAWNTRPLEDALRAQLDVAMKALENAKEILAASTTQEMLADLYDDITNALSEIAKLGGAK